MKLIKPQSNHIAEMMSWFSCEQELTDWSGPNFRFPYDLISFSEDLKLNMLSSFVLLSSKSEFLAFGQYYKRLDKCHLGRLIVQPEFRGQGLASKLIGYLSEVGLKELAVKQCSLFVLSHNIAAIKAYEKFGFSFADYPDEIELNHCLYMVK